MKEKFTWSDGFGVSLEVGGRLDLVPGEEDGDGAVQGEVHLHVDGQLQGGQRDGRTGVA